MGNTCSEYGSYGCFTSKSSYPYCMKCWSKGQSFEDDSQCRGHTEDRMCKTCKKGSTPFFWLEKHPSKVPRPTAPPVKPTCPEQTEAKKAFSEWKASYAWGPASRHEAGCAGHRYVKQHAMDQLRRHVKKTLPKVEAPNSVSRDDLRWCMEQSGRCSTAQKHGELYDAVQASKGRVCADTLLAWGEEVCMEYVRYSWANQDYTVAKAVWQYYNGTTRDEESPY